jgi:tellurite resistance protein TerC
MLAVDLGIFHRTTHAVSVKEATIWSAVWILLALLFNAGIYLYAGSDLALQFFTGYLIEKSLSVDNIFVFVLLFTRFQVPTTYQHRVLFWGVLGALVMRGALILLGTALISAFHWIFYIFGAFLLFTGIRMAFSKEESVQPEKNPALKLARRVFPVTPDYEGEHFWVRRAGRVMATPLLLVLVVVETTDLIFALDSIPAIFAVTQNAFLVYTSNVFAILGLRSLYFVFAHAMGRFSYLKPGLAVILCFVGAKMILADLYHISTLLSLVVIACILLIAVIASLWREHALARHKPVLKHKDFLR